MILMCHKDNVELSPKVHITDSFLHGKINAMFQHIKIMWMVLNDQIGQFNLWRRKIAKMHVPEDGSTQINDTLCVKKQIAFYWCISTSRKITKIKFPRHKNG